MSRRTIQRRTAARATTLASAALAVAVAVTLAACGSSTADSGTESSPSASAVSAADPWVKAVDTGMTAAFVTLTNTTGTDQVVVSAATPASTRVELHEMTMKNGAMVMQQKEGGITVPANGSAVLEPGGDHIMLMGVSAPIKPGDMVPITLTFASGATLEIDAVAKEFSGGDEPYHSSSASPTGSMDMSSSDSMGNG